MKKLTVIFLLLTTVSFGQYNGLLDQYMFNGIAQNPAKTGSENAFSVIGSFRAQWVGISGAPRTQTLTAHSPLKNQKLAIGLQLYADQIGVTKNTGIYFSTAYKLKFENSDLRFGLSGGLSYLQNNFSALDVYHSNDLLLGNESLKGVMPNFSFGLFWNSEKHFVGFSIPQFLTHNYDGNKFVVKNDFSNYNLNLNAGYLFQLNENFDLRPSILIKYRYQFRPQFDLNLLIGYNEQNEFGVSFRTEESILLLYKHGFNKQFYFMYSFGLPFTSLVQYSFGSHELTLKYNFFYKTKFQNPRRLF